MRRILAATGARPASTAFPAFSAFPASRFPAFSASRFQASTASFKETAAANDTAEIQLCPQAWAFPLPSGDSSP